MGKMFCSINEGLREALRDADGTDPLLKKTVRQSEKEPSENSKPERPPKIVFYNR